MSKLTKRDIVVAISNQTGMVQHQVFEVVQRTLDEITDSLARNVAVELRNFGVFQPRLTKPRVGRNPNQPGSSFVIPASGHGEIQSRQNHAAAGREALARDERQRVAQDGDRRKEIDLPGREQGCFSGRKKARLPRRKEARLLGLARSRSPSTAPTHPLALKHAAGGFSLAAQFICRERAIRFVPIARMS